MSPRHRIALLALLGAAATGCPGEPPGPPDADAGATGLRVEWAGRPEVLPAQVSSEVTLDRAVFRTHELRVVGDAGPIGLDRETLEWARGIVPAPDVPAGAPTGLYSRLLFELEGDDDGGEEYAYELVGTARVGSTMRPFTIRDAGELEVMLEFSIMLRAGEGARIPVRVELDKLVEAVDFAQAPVDDGRFLVEGGAQLAAVRAKLREAFGVHGEP
jgi:hypothetical protein